LTNIIIPGSVATIGDYAFLGCYGLTNVLIPGSITRIGDYAFAGCYGLTSVLIPGSVATIGDYAFERCTGLTNVALSEGVSSIRYGAFSFCYGLTNIALPRSVTWIAAPVFHNCSHLSAITVDALNPNYSSVEGVLFDKLQTMLVECPAGKSGSYTIPNTVTRLGDQAFSGCQGLTSVSIPDGVSFIPCSAFSSCYSLTNVTIPSSLTNIDSFAFSGCQNLRSFPVPDSVRSIGWYAFSCSGLTWVLIPKDVTSIGDGAFYGCKNLNAIQVDPLNPSYASVDGVLFEKNLGTLLAYPANRSGSYVIPGGVKRIGATAFSDCYGLTSVSIPNGVSTISDWAFSGCGSLTNVIIPASVTGLGYMAFSGCRSLTWVLLPEHLASIGEGAFQCCFALKAIIFIGDAPRLEGRYTFEGDRQVTVYYLPGQAGWDTTLGGLPTVPWSGTYYGLFYVAGKVSWESAGAFAMRATAKGRFSGQLLLAGRRHSLSGAFDPVGQASVTISRRNASALQVQFHTEGSDQITGSVSDGTWTAELTADRAVFDGKSSLAPHMGRYTMVIPGADLGSTTAPNGYGHGTITVDKSGQVRLSGALADNTKITQAAPLSRDGVWPVYVSLYRGGGLLLGWLTFTNTLGADLSGLLQWNKPTGADARFYPGGFLSDTSVQGWRYTTPKAGAKVLPFNNACLVLSGAGLQQDLTNHVVLQANNRVTSTNKTTLTFNLSTGAFRGGVRDPAHPGTKPIPFSGVLIQNPNIENSWPLGYGCGWFMGTNQCGVIHLYNDEAN
jgi:hypothetical protein